MTNLEQEIESIVRKEMAFEGHRTLVIPVPEVAPLGIEVDALGVQEVWDAFVVPTQAAGEPQSMEMRTLMAILRSVKAGFDLGEVREPE